MHIQKKFWKHVEEALNDVENRYAYYAGGTLSLYLGKNKAGEDRGICMNLNGKGFVLSNIKNTTVYLPDFITKIVRKIYLKHKGRTDHYIEEVEKKKRT